MAQPQSTSSIGEMGICIAMDTSGSTAGATLRNEIHFVDQILSLINPNSQKSFKVLPWSTVAVAPILLPENRAALDLIKSGSGTSPSSLYRHTECLAALKECEIWFLFTDGMIDDAEMHHFTERTTANGLHGKAVVIVIFGSRASVTPCDADISVGLATYALAANSLLIHIDIYDKQPTILQAKGCFKALLTDSTNPILDAHLRWDDLPKLHFPAFLPLQIPNPQALKPDEMALDDGLVIRLRDMYANNLAPAVLAQVSDTQHLKSLVMAEVARGKGKELEAWLASQHLAIPPPPAVRPDVDDKAKLALERLFQAIGNEVAEPFLRIHREALAAAHQENWKQFNRVFEEYEQVVEHRNMSNSRFGTGGKHSRSMRTSSSHTGGKAMSNPAYSSASASEYVVIPAEKNDTWLPGFKSPKQGARAKSSFSGRCDLCHTTTFLCLLFKALPENAVAPRGSKSPFPSAEATCHVPILDLLSTTIVCDACAHHLLAYYADGSGDGTSQLGDIVAAVACVGLDVEGNAAAWMRALDGVCKGGVRIEDLAKWLLAVLQWEGNVKAAAGMRGDAGLDGWRDLVGWVRFEVGRFCA